MENFEKIIINYFKDLTEIVSVDLFGSYASKLQQPTSDIDIAILYDHSQIPSALALIACREELSVLLAKDVDLVCLNTCSPIIGMQIAKKRKNLFMRSSRLYSIYEMYLFSDYAELKELRLPMEKNILKRKVI